MEAILPGFEEEGLGFKGPEALDVEVAGKRQGGPELWARMDAIKVLEPLDYPEQPVIRELDFDW